MSVPFIVRMVSLIFVASMVSAPALMESIKTQITKRYGPGYDVQFWINPELIGGLRVKVGSDVFDGSVKARLAELEANF